MNENKLTQAHELYIKNRPDGAAVVIEVLALEHLSDAVRYALGLSSAKVYIKTNVLKHLYERRPASVYDFLLLHLDELISQPDRIYHNKSSKRGAYVFARRFDNDLYICSLETNAHPETGEEVNVVVTAFKIDKKYLNKYKLVWSWEDGDASS